MKIEKISNLLLFSLFLGLLLNAQDRFSSGGQNFQQFGSFNNRNGNPQHNFGRGFLGNGLGWDDILNRFYQESRNRNFDPNIFRRLDEYSEEHGLGNIDLRGIDLSSHASAKSGSSDVPFRNQIKIETGAMVGLTSVENLLRDDGAMQVITANQLNIPTGAVAQHSTDGAIRTLTALQDESLESCINALRNLNPNIRLAEANQFCNQMRRDQNARAANNGRNPGGNNTGSNNPGSNNPRNNQQLISAPVPNILGVHAYFVKAPVADQSELDRIKNSYTTKLPPGPGGVDYTLKLNLNNGSTEVSPYDPRALFFSEYNIIQKIESLKYMAEGNRERWINDHDKVTTRVRHVLGDAVLVKLSETDASEFIFTPGALAKTNSNFKFLESCSYANRLLTYWKLLSDLVFQVTESMCNDFNDDEVLSTLLQSSWIKEEFDNFDTRLLKVRVTTEQNLPSLCFADVFELSKKSSLSGAEFIDFLNKPFNERVFNQSMFKNLRTLVTNSVGLKPAENSKVKRFEFNCQKIAEQKNKISTIFSNVTLSNYTKLINSISEYLSKDFNIKLAGIKFLSKPFTIPQEFWNNTGVNQSGDITNQNQESLNGTGSKNVETLEPYALALLKLALDLSEAKIKAEVYEFGKFVYSDIMAQSAMFNRTFYNSKFTLLEWMLRVLTELVNRASGYETGFVVYTQQGILGKDLIRGLIEKLRTNVEFIEILADQTERGSR